MELFKTMYKRRSIRRFLSDRIPQNVLNKILEAGTWAPSNCNLQGWDFIVLTDKKLKERLVKDAGMNVRVIKSPVTVIFCYDNYDQKISIQSLSAAVQNMLLAATALGVASCWLASCGNRKKIKEILNIPKNIHIASIAVFGYPQYTVPEPPPRKPLNMVVHKNKFNKKWHINYKHDPNEWTLDQINQHQYYYCRKTPFGVHMDINNDYELRLVQQYIEDNYSGGTILDILSYDGSYLQVFPKNSNIVRLDLNKQTSQYSNAAAQACGIKKSRGIIYNGKISLPVNSVSMITCIFKLERLPKKEFPHLFREMRRVLKKTGKILIISRDIASFYALIYFLIKTRLGDDVRNTAMYSYFGPYKPLRLRDIREPLEKIGFETKHKKYLIVPPIIDNLYQLYLQYKISGGTCYLHRIQRSGCLTKIIERMIQSQGLKESHIGSVFAIEAVKR